MDIPSTDWAGNFADQPSGGGHTYSEADLNFHVPCVTTGNYDSWASPWVGIGGAFDKDNHIVQTGIDDHRQYVADYGWITTYEAWVENLGDPQNPDVNYVFSTGCNDYMWVKVYSGHCMYIDDLSTGAYSMPCYGPNADSRTAEGILERDGGTLLADFGNVTFHGVGITDNGSYLGMNQVNHDYSNMVSLNGSHELASIGPILYDSTDSPPDMYTVTWLANS